MTSFSPQSLMISVETDVAPHLRMLTHPAAYQPHVSRKVLHEALHLWQLISRPYLWSMAAEELERLTRFESTGQVSAPGALRADFTRVDDEVGFSAENIHEAVARYWDVHVLGPHLLLELEHQDPARVWPPDIEARYAEARAAGALTREDGAYSSLAFDLAMEAAAGRYAAPYLMLRAVMSDRACATLFPLVGALAFQSRRPTWLFRHLLTTCQDIDVSSDDIHELWGRAWPSVVRATEELLRETGEDLDFTSLELPHGPGPAGPVHGWLAGLHARAVHELASESDAGLDPRQAPANVALQFAVPGDPAARGFLVTHFPPPAINLGATVWIPALDLEAAGSPLFDGTSPEELAEQVRLLHSRNRALARAAILAGLPRPDLERPPQDEGVGALVDALLRVTSGGDLRAFQWLVDVLSGDAAGDFAQFCERHARGAFEFQDALAAMHEIAFQLANGTALTTYDARRGVTRAWRFNPAELVLATAALMLVGRAADDDEYTHVAAALHLRVLEFLAGLDGALPAPLDELLRTRTLFLGGRVPPDSAVLVDAMIQAQSQRSQPSSP